MSNTDRETQNVIMAVQKAAFLMDDCYEYGKLHENRRDHRRAVY